jgi:hypothetical protein
MKRNVLNLVCKSLHVDVFSSKMRERRQKRKIRIFGEKKERRKRERQR